MTLSFIGLVHYKYLMGAYIYILSLDLYIFKISLSIVYCGYVLIN